MSKPKKYWRISPGGGGYLWREQKLHECIAIGWDIGNAKYMTQKKIHAWFRRNGCSEIAFKQFYDFKHNVNREDKVVASASGYGVYALGTVVGDYEYNEELEYPHSRKVRWETTFWEAVDIEALELPERFAYKFSGLHSQTIRELKAQEWDRICKRLDSIDTPFRNKDMLGGLIQSPEYENEVIILFSHLQERLNMRIVHFGTRFPDAIIERKRYGKWRTENVEFELYSSGFQDHLDEYKKRDCKTIICWEDDTWEDNRQKRYFEIIELREVLRDML